MGRKTHRFKNKKAILVLTRFPVYPIEPCREYTKRCVADLVKQMHFIVIYNFMEIHTIFFYNVWKVVNERLDYYLITMWCEQLKYVNSAQSNQSTVEDVCFPSMSYS